MKKLLLYYFCLISIITGCMSSSVGVYESYQESGSITLFDPTELRNRHLDSVNAIRTEKGLSILFIDHALNSSAATHARDLHNQQRAWNFGSDGSSPQERAEFAGFKGTVIGENISETFEGEFLVLQVWLGNTFPKSIILDPAATHLGLGWMQEENGKIWWVQVLGKFSEI